MRVVVLSILIIIFGITLVNSEQRLFSSNDTVAQFAQGSDIYPELPGLSIDEEEAESAAILTYHAAIMLTKADIDYICDSSFSKTLLRPPRTQS